MKKAFSDYFFYGHQMEHLQLFPQAIQLAVMLINVIVILTIIIDVICAVCTVVISPVYWFAESSVFFVQSQCCRFVASISISGDRFPSHPFQWTYKSFSMPVDSLQKKYIFINKTLTYEAVISLKYWSVLSEYGIKLNSVWTCGKSGGRMRRGCWWCVLVVWCVMWNEYVDFIIIHSSMRI